MFKVLIKKQLSESFRFIFFDSKKNAKRSKTGIAVSIALYAFILLGCLGGSFTSTAIGICKPLSDAGAGWLYFFIMSCAGVFAGACGSVFGTYSGLYLPKDNDLLLSMPIPVNKIIFSRLFNVYLLGTIYSSTAMIPTLIVYWASVGITFNNFVCGLILFLIITFIVLILSCLLGWVVAMVSLRIKRKSIFTVIFSLLFFGLYYALFFKMGNILSDLINNITNVSASIKTSAYFIYYFGSVGTGDLLHTLICFLIVAVVFCLLWIGISKTFIGIATASGKTVKTEYKEKITKQKTLFATLLKKEFGRFTSSANYMLNCGFGIILVFALAVMLLIKGNGLEAVFENMGLTVNSIGMAIATIGICLATTMINTAVPSVSLEGKNLWIIQSLPIDLKYALFAKAMLEFILSVIPSFIAVICAQIIFKCSIAGRIFSFVLIIAYTAFKSLFDTFLSIKFANVNWTNEQTPIKQSGNILIGMVIDFFTSVAIGAIYFAVGNVLDWGVYAAIASAVLIGISVPVALYLSKKGSEAFAVLN